MQDKKLAYILFVFLLVVQGWLFGQQSGADVNNNKGHIELSPETSSQSPEELFLQKGGTFTVQITNDSTVPIQDFSFYLDDEVKRDIKVVSLNNSTHDDSNKTDCNGDSVELEAGQTCQYKFEIKSTNQLTEVKSGSITISAANADSKTFYVDLSRTKIAISGNVFKQPVDNSSSPPSHNGITITNETPGGSDNQNNRVCFKSATVPTGQEFGEGISLPNSSFVGDSVGASSQCLSKYACSGDTDLKAGSSCQINVDVASDAYGSMNIELNGNFGTETARINVVNTYLQFFGGTGDVSNKTPRALIDLQNLQSSYHMDDDKQGPINTTKKGHITVKNAGNFDVNDIGFVTGGSREIIDNGCSGGLKAGKTCEMEIESGVFNHIVGITGNNLPRGQQSVGVGLRFHCKSGALSRAYLLHEGSALTLPGQVGPNMMVYRLYSGSDAGCSNGGARSKAGFLGDLDSSLDPSDFELWPSDGCIRLSDGKKITGFGNNATGRCDRILIYKPRQSNSISSEPFSTKVDFNAEFPDSHGSTRTYITPRLVVGGQFLSAGDKANTTNLAAWGLTAEDDNPVWTSMGAFEENAPILSLKVANSGSLATARQNNSGGGALSKTANIQNLDSLYVGGNFNDVNADVNSENIIDIGMWGGCPRCWLRLVDTL